MFQILGNSDTPRLNDALHLLSNRPGQHETSRTDDEFRWLLQKRMSVLFKMGENQERNMELTIHTI